MKTFTIKQLADAIRKNGYEQAFGSYIRPKKELGDGGFFGEKYYTNPENVEAACALGQAGLNLGVNPDKLAEALGKALTSEETARGNIVSMNDVARWPLAKIADWIEENWPLEKELHVGRD